MNNESSKNIFDLGDLREIDLHERNDSYRANTCSPWGSVFILLAYYFLQ